MYHGCTWRDIKVNKIVPSLKIYRHNVQASCQIPCHGDPGEEKVMVIPRDGNPGKTGIINFPRLSVAGPQLASLNLAKNAYLISDFCSSLPFDKVNCVSANNLE